jgi:hypothetical protein
MAPTAQSDRKPLTILRFLAASSSACKGDAVIESESRQAGKAAAGLWITWISGRKAGKPIASERAFESTGHATLCGALRYATGTSRASPHHSVGCLIRNRNNRGCLT